MSELYLNPFDEIPYRCQHIYPTTLSARVYRAKLSRDNDSNYAIAKTAVHTIKRCKRRPSPARCSGSDTLVRLLRYKCNGEN